MNATPAAGYVASLAPAGGGKWSAREDPRG